MVYNEGCLPRGCLPGGADQGGVYLGISARGGGGCLPGGCLGRPLSPHEMDTAAVGTHLTGMHFCFVF